MSRYGKGTASAVPQSCSMIPALAAEVRLVPYKEAAQTRHETSIKTVNLKSDMPPVPEALQRLDRELALARQQGQTILKIIHGYGSSGTGGDIRIAVQKRLHELAANNQIRDFIFGEDWSKSHDASWRLLQSNSDLKSDRDLGRGNPGITIVLL